LQKSCWKNIFFSKSTKTAVRKENIRDCVAEMWQFLLILLMFLFATKK